MIARYSYDAWGKCTVTVLVKSTHSKYTEYTEAANANVFRYRSYIYDTDLEMYYLHNRYYDPEVGRFLSEDPARDGTNWYAYCNGDSVNYVDPTGLWRTVNLGYQAEPGDTLWGLSVKLFGNGSYWRDLGYPYDLNERCLQVGDIISYDGGLIEYENGQAYVHKSNILYQNGGYHTPQPMPDPPKPAPAPPNPVSTPKPNTGNTPTPSTSSPGNGGSGGNKGGSSKPNAGSGSLDKDVIWGPPVLGEFTYRYWLETLYGPYSPGNYLTNQALLGCEHVSLAVRAKALYSSYECLKIIYNLEGYILAASIVFNIPSNMIRAILYRELICYGLDDPVADLAVKSYYIWGIGSKKDSSTGVGQIFAQTAIEAEKIVIGYNTTTDKWTMWQKLQSDDINVYYCAMVLKMGAINLGYDYIGEDEYEKIEKVFATYNDAAYGKAVLYHYLEFMKG